MALTSTLQSAGGFGNAFGSKPSTIPMPGSIYSEALGVNPTLGPLGTAASDVVGSELKGTLSPGTLNLLQDKAASYGVTSGMPGLTPGSLALNNLMNSIGLTSESLATKGVSDYGNLLGTTAQTQLDPALAADVNEWNSIIKSAPDPAAAGQLQISLMDKYLNALRNPAGGASFAGGSTFSPWAAPGIMASLGPGTTMSGPGTFRTPAPA